MRALTMAICVAASIAALYSCRAELPGAGVSRSLAQERKECMSGLSYELHFDLPSSVEEAVEGHETVRVQLDGKKRIVLDSRGNGIHSLYVNGQALEPRVVDEHIVIDKKHTTSGLNTVEISFTAGEQSLNRREHFLYTLLVPDRARTLFPCFDQPDLKARYSLSLSIPEEWVAVSNTFAESESIANGRKDIRFAETEPLSTYLFSFVAGEFESVSDPSVTAAGKPVHLYHRETDPEKVAQCGEVLRLVKESLDYLEDYTGMDYPFAKYDLIVLPDFQYGGMEHTGATLYNDKRIFVGARPTTDELLSRATLIAHETAHMWFGDLVTMAWFNDVWTKEVFANWFAAKMVRPVYPQVNHDLGDLKSYYAAAYSEDRTAGSNAIQRPLDNLADAGLIYCNIIYDKAPVVMEMLARRMGYDAFRKGVREYLRSFAYSNATWDDLIVIMSGYTDFDVAEWSRVWIKEKGMPVFRISKSGNGVTVTQEDPFGAGNIWQEEVEYTLIGTDGRSCKAVASFTDAREVMLTAGFDVVNVVPNTDATAYGRFVVSAEDAAYIMSLYPSVSDENERMSLLMTLYENVWHKDIPEESFVEWVCDVLDGESNGLIQSSMMSYAAGVAERIEGGSERFASTLRRIAGDTGAAHEFRLLAFRSLIGQTRGDGAEELYRLWEQQSPLPGLVLGENDYTNMAYQLMLLFPERSAKVREEQLSRITNPDRKESFSFISQAVAADKEARDAFFRSMLSRDGRPNESVVRSALGRLNNSVREEEAVAYIRPALDVLEEIQRTGDIFFPANWCASLLGGHCSAAAREEVQAFIRDNEATMNPLLMTKVLQAAGWLLQ